MGIDTGWDSLNHLKIISELESAYKIRVADNDIEKYGEMKAIVDLYKNLPK
ncbi:MAG: acyl carrier protein [Ignavibacteria bacterium]|nr:acyl carrier protein [Ignavibacteria bacterium]